jgi:hypothetical protein
MRVPPVVVGIIGLMIGLGLVIAATFEPNYDVVHRERVHLPASLVPPPKDIGEMVRRADVIIIGKVDSVLSESRLEPYGVAGKGNVPIEMRPTFPITDYKVSVQTTLKGDSIYPGSSLTLRELGHQSADETVSLSGSLGMSELGDRMLLLLGQNPDGTYGLHFGPFSQIDIDGDVARYAGHISTQPIEFTSRLAPTQLIMDVRDEVERQMAQGSE